ncbi:MAG: hypothetical protein LC803_13610 [Acidobacteria bacterium]|nr:hypothetical protein [Acidobacteriota bacterium]
MRTANYSVAYVVTPLFDQAAAHKIGSNIPIRLQLWNAANVNQSASSITVTALSVRHVSDDAPGVLASPGNSTPDYDFRYSGGSYHFNLQTGGYVRGTYRLAFKAGNDPTTHTLEFQVK